MDNIDRCCQLHEVIEVHYFVDHFAAQLYTDNGERLVIIGAGDTVQNAIGNLNLKLEGLTVDNVRKVPSLTGMKANKYIRTL